MWNYIPSRLIRSRLPRRNPDPDGDIKVNERPRIYLNAVYAGIVFSLKGAYRNGIAINRYFS